MSNSPKSMSDRDGNQVLRYAYNNENASISVDGFLTGAVGRKIEQTVDTTNVADDTLVLNFSENGVDLYEYTLIFTDDTYSLLISAERTA